MKCIFTYCKKAKRENILLLDYGINFNSCSYCKTKDDILLCLSTVFSKYLEIEVNPHGLALMEEEIICQTM